MEDTELVAFARAAYQDSRESIGRVRQSASTLLGLSGVMLSLTLGAAVGAVYQIDSRPTQVSPGSAEAGAVASAELGLFVIAADVGACLAVAAVITLLWAARPIDVFWPDPTKVLKHIDEPYMSGRLIAQVYSQGISIHKQGVRTRVWEIRRALWLLTAAAALIVVGLLGLSWRCVGGLTLVGPLVVLLAVLLTYAIWRAKP